MNVLHIMNYAANYRGNFIDSLQALGEKLKKDGNYSVYMFFPQAKTGEAAKWIAEMAESGEKTSFLSDDFCNNIEIIRSTIEKDHIEVVHTHFISMKQYLMISQAVGNREIKIVMHFHNHATVFTNPVKSWLRRTIYKRCTMIGVSESVANGLRSIYPGNKVYAVENAINFARLNEYETIAIREENGWGDAKVCLIFGFDFYRKGVDLAVKAVKMLRDRGENICLCVSLSTNEAYVKNEITEILGAFPEWIAIVKARNDVASYYRMADVFLTPSREEGFCYSAVEAAYCGANVVASLIPAQQNLVIPDGLWFESENVDQLAEQIEKACNRIEGKNPEDVMEKLKEVYDLDDWAEKVMKVYERK